jgi:transposase
MEKTEEAELHPDGLSEIVADKGYHSDRTLIALEDQGLRSYISEPDRGRRNWKDDLDAQLVVYANRRRIRGERGRRLQRMRGELLERPFAHMYETGGMRRTHLRGHPNILKRLLIHAAGFNLGLLMRTLIGIGTPRGLQGALGALLALLKRLTTCLDAVRGDLIADFACYLSLLVPEPVRKVTACTPMLLRTPVCEPCGRQPKMTSATGC